MRGGTQPTVCLCMIVRDEAELLPRCLQSVQGVVDDIVVVDTGSSDNTARIALGFGARLFHHPWQDSFSEARNWALRQVTSDWVLVLDADEELEREDAGLLRRVIQGKEHHAVFTSVLNYTPYGRTQLYSPRLFRHGTAHYEGIVHNQLVHKGQSIVSSIRIYHCGYALSPEKMNAKYERTTRLLRLQLQQNPQDLFAWYNLVHMYRNRRQFELAARTGHEVLEDLCFGGKETLFVMLCYDVACSYVEIGDLSKAESFCRRALKVNPEFIDALFVLGVVRMKMRQWEKAARAFGSFIEVRARVLASPVLHRFCLGTIDYEFLAYAFLGECVLHLGAGEQARDYFRQAMALFRAWERGWPAAIPPHPDILMQMGNIAVRLGRIEEATELFEKCLGQGMKTAQLLNNLAGCYAKLGKVEEAVTAYRDALRLNPHYEEARRNVQVLLKACAKRAQAVDMPVEA
ncbi:MAG: tetratricopeptide repeat protein [candidate division KSB1 bacterium]|nr:tetratricopeptide repeat protein [candidate division KSB1 bacterium]